MSMTTSIYLPDRILVKQKTRFKASKKLLIRYFKKEILRLHFPIYFDYDEYSEHVDSFLKPDDCLDIAVEFVNKYKSTNYMYKLQQDKDNFYLDIFECE